MSVQPEIHHHAKAPRGRRIPCAVAASNSHPVRETPDTRRWRVTAGGGGAALPYVPFGMRKLFAES